MPARREMHTGRHNFLHRSWGPLEPFDDSMPELCHTAGVHSHKVTDHHHYWEDGGATYHQRFRTHEFVRGQEGDWWKGDVDKLRDKSYPPQVILPGEKMGEIRSKRCEGRELTKDQLAGPRAARVDARGSRPARAVADGGS